MDRLNDVFSAKFVRKGGAAFWRLARWPARIIAARAAMRALAGMSDHELSDIGLSRQDLRDATALPIDADPTLMFATRAQERKSAQFRASGLGEAKGPGQPKTDGPRLSRPRLVAAE